MIPIRDTIPYKNYPFVNYGFILVNVILYVYQVTSVSALNQYLFFYGLVPAKLTDPAFTTYFSSWQKIFPFVTFMFLHGSFWHLLGNMWFLHIFGDNIEDKLGPFRYFIFYMACGIGSGLVHFLSNMYSRGITIGASGAIAGVMGAYFILYPRSKILTLIPIIIIPIFLEIPAFFFLGFWFLLQFLQATSKHAGISGIAFWAHVGGFVLGMFFLKLSFFIPKAGITDKVQKVTEKRKSHMLQLIRPNSHGEDNNLYGAISITPYEAAYGTNKLVNIPWGFYNRSFRVKVPAGIRDGSTLRLKGLGKQIDNLQKGDLLLKVMIASS